jgi:hypothetical protein
VWKNHFGNMVATLDELTGEQPRAAEKLWSGS